MKYIRVALEFAGMMAIWPVRCAESLEASRLPTASRLLSASTSLTISMRAMSSMDDSNGYEFLSCPVNNPAHGVGMP